MTDAAKHTATSNNWSGEHASQITDATKHNRKKHSMANAAQHATTSNNLSREHGSQMTDATKHNKKNH